MSENGKYQRNKAVRVLATELQKADYHFKENDQERAPKYLLLPSGGKANRVMIGGTLLRVEDASSGDKPFWKAKVEDPTGNVTLLAGDYQPEASSVLRSISESEDKPPAFVNVVGKTREYRPDDEEDKVIVNISPENVSVVTEEQKNNRLRETVDQTIERLEQTEGEYVRRAEDRYGNRTQLIKDEVLEALESIE